MDGIAPKHGPRSAPDADPGETQEWLDSLTAVIAAAGAERGQFPVHRLEEALRTVGELATGLAASAPGA